MINFKEFNQEENWKPTQTAKIIYNCHLNFFHLDIPDAYLNSKKLSMLKLKIIRKFNK
jgi:hypothetical protein